MSQITLKDANGVAALFEEGSSSNIVGTFVDFAGEQIDKEAIISLELTLFDYHTNKVINDREEQDILDDNDGLVSDEGELTLRLGPEDNIVNNDTKEEELHAARLVWTWNDGEADRTGIKEVIFGVKNLVVVAVAEE